MLYFVQILLSVMVVLKEVRIFLFISFTLFFAFTYYRFNILIFLCLRAIDLTSNAIDPTALMNLTTQHELAEAWSQLHSSPPLSSSSTTTQVHILPSIEDAVKLVRNLATEDKKVEVLVAGSLHLVGGLMAVAEVPLDI